LGRSLALATLAIAASAFVAPVGASAGTVKTGPLPQFRMWPANYTSTIHYTPTRERARKMPSSCGTACDLHYNGGPVAVTPHIYVILWNFKHKAKGIPDPDHIGPLMRNYVGNFGGSGYGNIATQYYQGSGASKKFISNPSGQGSVWDDNVNPIPAHASDSQIQQEALKGVAHFGYDPNGAYTVVSAYQHDPQGFVTQGWCAYHGSFSSSSGIVAYTNLPYMPDAGSSCGANIVSPPPDESGTDEGQTIVAGHEYTETVTDPHPSSGWYNNNYGEIGDICAWQNIQNDPFGTFSFTQQPEWSNKDINCVHSD
jgi:hypothetical protein